MLSISIVNSIPPAHRPRLPPQPLYRLASSVHSVVLAFHDAVCDNFVCVFVGVEPLQCAPPLTPCLFEFK